MKKRLLLVMSLLLLALVASACSGGTQEVRVSSKEFTEQFILGEMYKQLLEDAGFEATFSPVGGTAENHQALVEGQIDVYPEYTGTIAKDILKLESSDLNLTGQGRT